MTAEVLVAVGRHWSWAGESADGRRLAGWEAGFENFGVPILQHTAMITTHTIMLVHSATTAQLAVNACSCVKQLKFCHL